MKTFLSLIAALTVVFAVGVAGAQQPAAPAPAPTPYGLPINLEQAKKVMAGAEAEAKKNSWPVAIVILDSGGQMVMMQRLDNTQWGSVDIAKEKARTAVALRRPTKVLQDGIAQGGVNLRFLSTGFSVLEGESRSCTRARSSARSASPECSLRRTPRPPRRVTTP